MPNKELIKKKFSKSLATYEKNAIVQIYMADLLLQELVHFLDCRVGQSPPRNDIKNKNSKSHVIARHHALHDVEAIQEKKYYFDKILEIGCGAGLLTKQILKDFNFSEFFVNDMSEDSLNYVKSFQIFTPHPASSHLLPQGAKGQLKLRCGDCENIKLPTDLDLVISNATFQWVEDFPSLLNKIHSSLKSQGILAFTTFGEQNFHQIKTITGKSLNYYNQKKIENMLSKSFKIIYSNSEIINVEFDSAYEILKHLKLCGVNALEQTKWTKKDLNDFEGKYNNFITSNGKLPLTYQPMYFIAQKL